MIEPTNLPALLVCPLCYLHANTVRGLSSPHMVSWLFFSVLQWKFKCPGEEGWFIGRSDRRVKTFVPWFRLTLFTMGHFILNSFSLTTQQNRIYRLPDTIRTRASDVTWEVGRINLLNCLFISPESLGSLCLVWEWSIYVVVMNVIFIRWWGEGRGERCYDCGQQTLSVDWISILIPSDRTHSSPLLPTLTLILCRNVTWVRSEEWGWSGSPGRRFCWPIRWSDGQTDAQ